MGEESKWGGIQILSVFLICIIVDCKEISLVPEAWFNNAPKNRGEASQIQTL